MGKDIFFQIHENLPREGPGRSKYTRKAFRTLPKLNKPRILDVGCGSGVPTIELARLSQGEVIGIDINQHHLDRFSQRIKEANLSYRVRAVNRSMSAMDFPDGSFDIIWAEGSIFIIGFETGLKEWQRFLKPGGFLVVHEMVWLRPDPPQEMYNYWKNTYPGITTVDQNLKVIQDCGYEILGHFTLPADTWWTEYYEPLECRIQELRPKYTNNPEALLVLDREQQEIDMFKKYCSKWYRSAFFIMKKK